MKTPPLSLKCPACGGALVPRVMACPPCGIRIEARFILNEFAALAQDDLRFLRVFVHCEGRIREMEAALGISYPTVKARLAALKERLGLERPAGPGEGPAQGGTLANLEAMERGEITFEDLLRRMGQ